jgi:hypothetical protein
VAPVACLLFCYSTAITAPKPSFTDGQIAPASLYQELEICRRPALTDGSTESEGVILPVEVSDCFEQD